MTFLAVVYVSRMQVLSARGCALVLNGIDKDEVVSSAVEQCLQQGATSVQYHGANLSHPEQIEDLFGFIRAKCGKTPDILVNNAGKLFSWGRGWQLL